MNFDDLGTVPANAEVSARKNNSVLQLIVTNDALLPTTDQIKDLLSVRISVRVRVDSEDFI